MTVIGRARIAKFAGLADRTIHDSGTAKVIRLWLIKSADVRGGGDAMFGRWAFFPSPTKFLKDCLAGDVGAVVARFSQHLMLNPLFAFFEWVFHDSFTIQASNLTALQPAIN